MNVARIFGLIMMVVALVIGYNIVQNFGDIFESQPSTGGNGSTAPVSGVVQPRQSPPSQTPSQSTEERNVTASFGSISRPSRIQIRASGSGNPVNVTGWKIQSKTGEYIIPQAIEQYTAFSYEQDTDIFLSSGDYVNMYAWQSANGQDFRLNKCIGYLSFLFNPSLPKNCPRLYESKRDIAHLTGRCQDYITSLSRCEIPSNNPPVRTDDYQCREFLNDVNYRSCYEEHRQDNDFLSREWRIWMGTLYENERIILDEEHDWVKLINTIGEVVDEYIY